MKIKEFHGKAGVVLKKTQCFKWLSISDNQGYFFLKKWPIESSDATVKNTNLSVMLYACLIV